MAEHDSQHEPVQVHGTGNPLRCQGLFHQGLEPEFLQHRDHRQQSAIGRQILPVEVIGRGGADFIRLRRSLSGALFRGAFIVMLISVRHHLGDLLRVDSAKRQLRDSPLQPHYLRGPQMVRYASTFRRTLAKVHESRYMLVEMGCEEIRGVPELLAYQRNGVGKGWLRLSVPSGLANGEFSRTRQAMSQQSNDGEQAEQYRCGAGNRQAGPLALCLYSQMSPDFLEGHLYLPAPKEPLQDLTGILIELGAEQSAGFELAFGVSHQHPTDGHWRQTSVIPNRGAGSDFY